MVSRNLKNLLLFFSFLFVVSRDRKKKQSYPTPFVVYEKMESFTVSFILFLSSNPNSWNKKTKKCGYLI